MGVVLLGAIAARLYTQQVGDPIFPVDDAYISLHNAEVLFAGDDTHFVGTPALVGSTSALHVVLSAVFQLFFEPLWAQWIVMILGGVAFALAVLRLAFVLGASAPEALLMVAASLVVGQIPHQLANGLETSWALAGLTLAIAASRDGSGPRWQLPVVCALLPYLRPELVVVSGLLMLQRTVTDLRTDRAEALRTVKIFAAALAPWVLLYLLTVGSLYPNTIQAKKFFFAEGCFDPAFKADSVRNAFVAFGKELGFIGYAAVLLVLTLTGWVGIVFAGVFAYAYFTNFPGALFHYEQRYMYVLVPWVLYAVGTLIGKRHVATRAAAALLFVVAIVQNGPEVAPRWQFHSLCNAFTRVELDGVATWLANNAAKRKILLHDAGYVGYFVDAPMADMVGLKTPASIPPHRELTWSQCGAGRQQAIHDIALHEQPTFVVVLAGWDGIYRIIDGLRARGWTLEPRYQHHYVVYEVTGRPST
ncbi:MAG: hypothetical protein RLZZ450_6962 [Pseudomonadota bacterium]|jgi:hypothetical protein